MTYKSFILYSCLFAVCSCMRTHNNTNTTGSISLNDSSVVYGGDWYKPSNDAPCISLTDEMLKSSWMETYKTALCDISKEKDFDYTNYCLADINEDGIPEILLAGGSHASAFTLLTIFNNIVYRSPQDCFYSYISGGTGLIHGHDRHGDYEEGRVYKLENGKFLELYRYSFDSNSTDRENIENNLDYFYFSKGESLRIWNEQTEWIPINVLLN